MRIQNRLRAAVAPVALTVALLAQPAYAQDAAATSADEDTASADGAAADEGSTAIVVTGSRIRRPNLESTIPITSISGDTVIQSGDPNIGDTLNELPQLRSTFAQQNPGLGIGIAGLNLLDLRGLGTQRTLVLVNGRRHVAGDILNNASSPDVNTIPNDLIERVDVVTGGNSAVYGSDAIAGVVNFVLKRDFEGLQIRGNFGMPDFGGSDNQYISAMVGQNFSDGRGNITLHGEYSHQDRIFASDVPWLAQQDGFIANDVDPAGLVNGSDGIPDRVFGRDIRTSTINRYGMVVINQNPANPTCGLGIGTSAATQVPYSCAYIFTPTGELVQQTGGRVGAGPNGTFLGGNGQTGREDYLLSVIPQLDRYNFNVLAHYEFSEAAELFVEAKYARAEVQGSNFGPSFMQGTFGQFDYRERIRLDNPFLTAAQRTQIANAILASGCNTNLSAGCGSARTTRAAETGTTIGTGGPLNAADIAAVNARTYRFVLARNLQDIDIRDEIFTRETYRGVVGLRGVFNDDWSYEVSFNYGRSEENTVASGFLDRQRFVLALDAGLNPATGRIECRSKFDPAARVAYSSATASRLNDDIAACVPYNPFGAADNTAAATYARGSYTNEGWAEQMVVSGFVSGDTSEWFELPGGPVSFAVGGEYRREDAFYDQSDDVAFTTAVNFGSFEPDATTVKEAYGELRLPILADVPFFEELTLSGAGRVAKYKGGVGTVFAYNGGVDWAPFQDLRFRANYGRAIRAPNATETSGELVPNFAPGFADPCRPGSIGSGSQFRGANCQADLGPLLANLNSLGTYSLQVLSGVNPDLAEEKSDSITIGAVFQPSFIPGLNLSVDYYDITVDGVIASLSAQQIVDSCYDQPTLDNPFCGLFSRWRGPGNGPFNELPGQVEGNTTVQAPFNYAKRIRRGIDTNLSYRTRFGQDVTFLADLIYTHNLKISNYTNPTLPDFENRILGELGDPVDEFRLDVDLGYKAFTFGYRMRYIGPMWVNAYEDFNSLQGRAPQDADWADIQKYPQTFYHDIRFQWDLSTGSGREDNLRVYAGIDNVLDTKPPLGSTATGAGSAIYDVRGRTLYAGFRVRY